MRAMAGRSTSIAILKLATQSTTCGEGEMALAFDELKREIRTGAVLRRIFRYREVRLVTSDLDTLPRPFLTAVVIRLLGYGRCRLIDERGRCVEVTVVELAKLGVRLLADSFRGRGLIRRTKAEVKDLLAASVRLSPPTIDLSGHSIYIRADCTPGLVAGGSVAHTAGVVNNLAEFAGSPVFLAPAPIPTVSDAVERHVVRLDDAFRDFSELPLFHRNDAILRAARSVLQGRSLAFVYQRYSINNYAGLKLAREWGVPFVLEYNGSETWVRRQWGGERPRYEPLSERIEMLNLLGADLVVVVSRVLRDELTARGVARERILVNPNGVDPERYSPSVDGTEIRARYGFGEAVVIGFIGTFGAWHGAEILADAFGRLVSGSSPYRKRVRLLMVGDGARMAEAKEVLARHGGTEYAVWTGLVPQRDGPAHLAACDILVASHVPNPDRTRFFGSPTKLFEYMAMGKGIVASDLDQIGEVLQHGRSAWLVRPGDVEDLVRGLQTLIDDPALRERLGRNARSEVMARYTWREHTRRIVSALEKRCA